MTGWVPVTQFLMLGLEIQPKIKVPGSAAAAQSLRRRHSSLRRRVSEQDDDAIVATAEGLGVAGLGDSTRLSRASLRSALDVDDDGARAAGPGGGGGGGGWYTGPALMELALRHIIAGSREHASSLLFHVVERGATHLVKAILKVDLWLRERAAAKRKAGEEAGEEEEEEEEEVALVCYEDDEGVTPLLLACREDLPHIVALLLGDPECDVNHACENDRAVSISACTPLKLAADTGNRAMLALLLAHEGIDVNFEQDDEDEAGDEDGEREGGEPVSALYLAGYAGHLECCKALLEAGADPECADEDECGVLYNAAVDGRPELVKLLIAHGADVNAAADDGSTPLFVARKGRHLLVEQLLVAAGAEDAGGSDDDGGEGDDGDGDDGGGVHLSPDGRRKLAALAGIDGGGGEGDDGGEAGEDGLDAVAAARRAAAVDRGRFT